jgi:hypothetical protein
MASMHHFSGSAVIIASPIKICRYHLETELFSRFFQTLDRGVGDFFSHAVTGYDSDIITVHKISLFL